jgi:putative hydrolase of HD superfamily
MDETTRTAHFLHEVGTLKNQRRTGWWMAGIRDPESVAEHSWRTSLIASVIASMEGADPARASLIATWHDTGESRSGDVNHLGRKYIDGAADPRAIAADQTKGMPAPLAELVQGAIAEYEAQESTEAVCAKDADKLECLIQGVEYKAQGHTSAQRWIDNSRARLKTKSGQSLADAILAGEPMDWLRTTMGEG